ncbi:MAG TPA: HD domain-containing phosphohydrolase [Terriglobia bacterium]|nr:HD domain-containing phosphohydrolase [Terriglobia bacterium]
METRTDRAQTSTPPTMASVHEPVIPLVLGGTWPSRLRDFIVRHLEFLFVLAMAVIFVVVFYFLPYKIAFLNFFFLPVLTAAYMLGRRQAVMGAVLCLLSGVLFAYYRPEWFTVAGTHLDAFLVLGTWGGFLILTSASIGSLQENLDKGFHETRRLYEDLKRSRDTEIIKKKVEDTLFLSMDPIVAKLATEGKLRFEKREISILFAELADFTTSSAESRPEVVLEDMNHFLGRVEPIVERFYGHIDKYMGDGVMVEFGAPVDLERHALLAVLAGLKMQEMVRTIKLPWRLSVGIASGPAIVGMLGVKRQAYSALGDRVNIAKRLQEICEPGRIYIDEPTYKAVAPFINATKLRLPDRDESPQPELAARLHLLEEKLRREGESAGLLEELGEVSSQLHDLTAAVDYFARALKLDPSSSKIKLAYADATIQQGEIGKVQLKGKQEKVTVYEVAGIRDRWSDSALIPPAVAAKYGRALDAELPHDIVLATEALDATVGHGRVVALLSYAIADRLNLDDETKRATLLAGYFQNLGNEVVNHHDMNLTGNLTDQESGLLEASVHASMAACRRLGYEDPRLLEIVLHHHEAWDGRGYPERLQREAIPMGSRITAVAETFSTLTSWRPYREAWDVRAALKEIRRDGAKGRYDPQVVEAITEILTPNA